MVYYMMFVVGLFVMVWVARWVWGVGWVLGFVVATMCVWVVCSVVVWFDLSL